MKTQVSLILTCLISSLLGCSQACSRKSNDDGQIRLAIVTCIDVNRSTPKECFEGDRTQTIFAQTKHTRSARQPATYARVHKLFLRYMLKNRII